jgi:NAD(P)-dependent dehydrogenase (short-subunit alcohol dehydrogenase family)
MQRDGGNATHLPCVFITGANRGLGLELARQYASDGWSVIAGCRAPARADDLADLPGAIEMIELDLDTPETFPLLPDRLRRRPIDVLINNAGIGGGRHGFGRIEPADFMAVMRVNCLAPLMLMQVLADQVAKSQRRCMVAIGSRMGSIGEGIEMGDADDGGDYAYRCSKSALNMAVATAAFDLRSRGISTLVLHPGWVKTDMGGAQAELTVADSAAGLRRVIAGIDPATSGKFFTWDGREVAW